MSIWTYAPASTSSPLAEEAVRARALVLCVFCKAQMIELANASVANPGFPTDWSERRARCCPVCGWWVLREERHGRDAAGAYAYTSMYGSTGILKQLSMPPSAAPLNELRQYLAAQYADRHKVDPTVLEHVVASVYRGHGYLNVRVVGRTGDEGIDIVMEGPGDALIGVQVKRYRDKILADQIREFTGSLVLQGLTRGIFVTTSSFTAGAEAVAAKAEARGLAIELVDAARFYDALGIAQRAMYIGPEDSGALFRGAASCMSLVRAKRAWL
jgi:restriction system protein